MFKKTKSSLLWFCLGRIVDIFIGALFFIIFLSKNRQMIGATNSKLLGWGDSFRYPQLGVNPQTENIMSKSWSKYNEQSTGIEGLNSQSWRIQSQNLISRKPVNHKKEINASASLLNLNNKNSIKPSHQNIGEMLKEVESVSSLDTFQHSKSPNQKQKNSVEAKKQILHESKEIPNLLHHKKYNNYISLPSNNISACGEKVEDKNKRPDGKFRGIEKNSTQISLMVANSQKSKDPIIDNIKSDQNYLSEQKNKRIWSPSRHINSNSPQKIDRSTFESQKLNMESKTPKNIKTGAEISNVYYHTAQSKNLTKKTKRIFVNSHRKSGQENKKIDHSQPVPRFLRKKTNLRKVLTVNQIVRLKVLTSTCEQVTASLLVLKLLAENEATTAYLVLETKTNFLFCLKKCFIRNDPKQFQFLMREGKFGGKLNHPSVLKTYCTLYDQQNVYQLLQYMEGSTLFQKTHDQRCSLAKRKSSKSSANEMKVRSIKLVMGSLLEGIVYMHSQGVIHRDIKPSNIFIAYDNTLKIGDFGSCGYKGSRDYVGTLDYVSPEVLLRKKYDEKVDVWSVGCIGYELWVGSPPFYHSKRETTINNIIQMEFEKEKIENASFLNLLTRLLEKDSSKRISAAEALEHPFLGSPQQLE